MDNFSVFSNKSSRGDWRPMNFRSDEEPGNSARLRKIETWDYAFGGSSASDKMLGLPMAREVKIGPRRFYIVSEPDNGGWRAQVLEILDDRGATQEMGIETTGETRTLADDRALTLLQHKLKESHTDSR